MSVNSISRIFDAYTSVCETHNVRRCFCHEALFFSTLNTMKRRNYRIRSLIDSFVLPSISENDGTEYCEVAIELPIQMAEPVQGYRLAILCCFAM